MTSSSLIEPGPPPLPPVVRGQLEAPAAALDRSWRATIAPAFLAVMTWFPLLDPLGAVDRSGAGVLARFLSAGLALIACYALLYRPLAMLGLSSRRRLSATAAASLGVQGAEWITGVLYGLFAAVWCSVALSYSVRLVLSGLVEWRLVGADDLLPTTWGGLPIESPLALAAMAHWLLIILPAVALGLMGAIAAMMRVYAPFVLVLLTGAAAWAWIHAPAETFRAASSSTSTIAGSWTDGTMLEPGVFQLVFGAFAFAGLMGVEWGAGARDRRDVRLGGLVGIVAAGALAILSALILAATGPDGTVRSALVGGLGGTIDRRIAATLLLLFGLASLAPACFASALFTRRFREHFPALRRWNGVWLGALLFWLPAATTLSRRPEIVFSIAGALFASIAGVLAAESLRSRGRWAGLRAGWNAAGVSAWGVGVLVGLAPVVGRAAGHAGLRAIEPAALFAWLASAVVYLALLPLAPPRPTMGVEESA